MALKVSDIGEKGLINYILTKSEDIIADDTAITEFKDTNLISTCDMLIESKHFPEGMSYFQMGFKAVTVNVSDLAAMGADPLGFLLSSSPIISFIACCTLKVRLQLTKLERISIKQDLCLSEKVSG